MATPPPKPSWKTLFSLHSAGGTQILAETNAAALRKVLELPESAVLRTNLSAKLVTAASGRLFPGLDPSLTSPLLAPLFDDLLTRETWLALRLRSTDRDPAWQGAVLLDPSKLTLWQTNLGSLLGLGSNAVRTVTIAGVAGSESKLGAITLRFATVGNWFVWGSTAGSDSGLDDLVSNVSKTGRPCPAASEYWLQSEADLEALKIDPHWPLPTQPTRVSLKLAGHKGRMTTSAQVSFRDDPGLQLERWTIPTNAVHDPLVSFTASQGLDVWAKSWNVPTNVAIPKLSSQLFVWARGDVAFMTLFATPMPDATNVLQSLSPSLISHVNKELDGKGTGGLVWVSNRVELAWRGLPAMIPYVRPWADADGQFLHGGLFPVSKAFTNPAPAELLGQVAGRTNLVYYDWEITEERLAHWTQMFQFLSLVSMRPKFDATTSAHAWLKAVAPLLGNAITEITRESPREFHITRRSEAGFTGIELNFLAQWFDETNFPSAPLRMPFEPVGFAVPPPRAPRGTNRVRAPMPTPPGLTVPGNKANAPAVAPPAP